MNFGPAGVAVYFLLLGFALVRAGSFVAGRPTRLALLAVVLGPLLWTTRGSFDSFFRPAVWGVLCVLGARVVADSLRATSPGFDPRTPPRREALSARVFEGRQSSRFALKRAVQGVDSPRARIAATVPKGGRG